MQYSPASVFTSAMTSGSIAFGKPLLLTPSIGKIFNAVLKIARISEEVCLCSSSLEEWKADMVSGQQW